MERNKNESHLENNMLNKQFVQAANSLSLLFRSTLKAK